MKREGVWRGLNWPDLYTALPSIVKRKVHRLRFIGYHQKCSGHARLNRSRQSKIDPEDVAATSLDALRCLILLILRTKIWESWRASGLLDILCFKLHWYFFLPVQMWTMAGNIASQLHQIRTIYYHRSTTGRVLHFGVNLDNGWQKTLLPIFSQDSASKNLADSRHVMRNSHQWKSGQWQKESTQHYITPN